MSNNSEIKLFVRLIKKGTLTINDVPESIRETVRAALHG